MGGTGGGIAYNREEFIDIVKRGPAYRLEVPVAVHLADTQHAFQSTVSLEEKRQSIALELPARPLQLDIDPEFDLFRRLHRNEIPPAVSQAMAPVSVLRSKTLPPNTASPRR